MKKINLKTMVMLFLGTISLTAISQTEKIWVTIENLPEINVDQMGKLTVNDPNFQNVIDHNNVVNIQQALPSSKQEELLKVYEIECNCDAIDLMIDITNSELGTSKPELAPKYELLFETNDYHAVFQNDYALDLINAKGAWDYSKGDSTTLIGICDANYHLANVDLANKYLSFSSGNTDPNYAHGTAVALTAAGDTDNNAGKSSIGYNCMMHLRAMSYNNLLDLSYVGCKVINVSWTSGCYQSSYVQDVVDEIYNNGTILVCAAGNGSTCGGPTNLVYPAACDHTIAVSSIGPYNNHERTIGDPTTTHQHNASVDICAPGYDIASGTTWTFGPSLINGTSFAAPYVTGTIGLILTERPCLSYEEVLNILQQTAYGLDTINPNYAGLLGAGRLDAEAALLFTSQLPDCPYFENYTPSGITELPEINNGNTGNNVIHPDSESQEYQQFELTSENTLNNSTSTHSTAGIENLDQSSITLFPNPASDKSQISWGTINEGELIINVFDSKGTVVYQEVADATQGRTTLDIEQRGVFFVEILLEGNKYWQGKLVRI